VTAIAGDVGFLKGECIHQHCLDFIIFHGFISSGSENKPNILEQSGAVLNKQKAPTIKLSRLSIVTY
jgi:hypothetical protein